MSAGTDTGKKTGYHHHDLRNALQDEALRFISERNGPAFSLRELAEAVGVSHTAVYRHFANKAALLEALTERGFGVLHRYQQSEIAKAGSDPLERLHALDEAYIAFARENPGAFWLMFGNRGEETDRAKSRPNINKEALRELIDAIVLCQREEIIIPGDPFRIASYLIMAPHGLACYSAKDLEMVGVPGEVMTTRMLAEIALIPVMTNPPSPGEITSRYFSA
ncbi:TetR family transcriptional regulator [Chelativorans sp. ZYF759]|uniref:TetR/AcrR family transcriptional regulator n=1 Tax=Chelativorans sp. ZYF759 TaxID=2692213 RepID=UPI00145D0289|nr:TetR family transcriptional regulator [Chelativorans sp. ZYF759]